MATVSSHVLDSVSGLSAAGVRIECTRVAAGGAREQVFDVRTDGDGRIAEPVEITSKQDDYRYELVFHSGDYLAGQPYAPRERQIMRTVVVHLCMPDPDSRYHIPVLSAPHSYTVWWSA